MASAWPRCHPPLWISKNARPAATSTAPPKEMNAVSISPMIRIQANRVNAAAIRGAIRSSQCIHTPRPMPTNIGHIRLIRKGPITYSGAATTNTKRKKRPVIRRDASNAPMAHGSKYCVISLARDTPSFRSGRDSASAVADPLSLLFSLSYLWLLNLHRLKRIL